MNAPIIDIDPIVENLAYVDLHTANWGASAVDKGRSIQIAKEMGAREDLAKVTTKQSGAHPLTEAAQKITGMAGNAVRDVTAPYGVKGQYLITSNNIDDVNALLTKGRSQHDHVTGLICGDEYDNVKAHAMAACGDGFDAAKFPSREKMRTLYKFQFRFTPLPKVNDPIRGVTAATQKAVQEAMEAHYREAFADAAKGIYERTAVPLANMVKQLRNDGENKHGETIAGSWQASLITNVEKVADVLINVNIFNDPVVEQLGRDMKAALTVKNVEAVKADPFLRKRMADDADNMLKRLNGLAAA